MDFESRSSAIPTPGLLFINKKSDTSAFILRRYPILPSGPNKLTNILLKPFEDFQLGALYPKTVAFICTSRIECHIGVLRCARTTNARRICRAASPLETACIRRGLKVAARLLSLRGDCLIWATFARRLRAVSTFGLRQMPAARKPPSRCTKTPASLASRKQRKSLRVPVARCGSGSCCVRGLRAAKAFRDPRRRAFVTCDCRRPQVEATRRRTAKVSDLTDRSAAE